MELNYDFMEKLMSEKKEHRFWVCINNSMVKIKLKKGTTLNHPLSWYNGEGNSYRTESWGFYYGNPEVICHSVSTSGYDCDGQHQDMTTRICSTDQLKVLRPHKGQKERRPNWRRPGWR